MPEHGHDADASARADSPLAGGHNSERTRSSDESVAGVTVHKVCCVCGGLLNHKTRFKDSHGRYWCATCNEADHRMTHPAPCADCGIETPRPEMEEIHGVLLCPVCVNRFMNDSKAVGELRIRALAHGPHAKPLTDRRTSIVPIIVATLLLLIAIAMLAYRFA